MPTRRRSAEAVKAAHVKDWSSLHERKSRQYRPENPDLPTLDPWQNTTTPPAELFVFKRNPYFHRVDENGQQLPYIDEVRMTLGTTSLIPAKAASGDADLQARYINFEDYTFLKRAEKINGYDVRLWERGEGAYTALMPNLNAGRSGLAQGACATCGSGARLSLGINRRDINRVIFFGLARESANTVLPQSPLYKQAYADAYANYDPAEANRLLDEAGLAKRDAEGFRLLAGRPAGRHHRRHGGHQHRRCRRARTHQRRLGQARHPLLQPSLAARRVPAADQERRGDHVARAGHGQRRADIRSSSPIDLAPFNEFAGSMAAVGALHRKRMATRASRSTCRRRSNCSTSIATGGVRRNTDERTADLGQDAGHQRRPSVHHRHRQRHAAAGRRGRQAAATCPKRRSTPSSPARSSASTCRTRSGSTTRAD